jgi:SPP1 gp7 family putative phage head morphogenesis protein
MDMNPLADVVTRQQVLLERLKAGEVKKIQPFLQKIDRELRDQLTREDITGYHRNRVERLLKGVDGMMAEVFGEYQAQTMNDLDALAEHSAQTEHATLQVLKSEMPFEAVIPPMNQVLAAIRTNPLSVRGADGGKLLEPFLEDWSRAERSKITGAIRQGYFEGKTTDQIIRTVRGTKALQYKDGLLDVTYRNAQAIIHTAIQHVASTARMETLRENSDITEKYQWVSTLDSRTSTSCRSLDGQEFEYGKGPLPPIHIRCRSSYVPVLTDEFSWLSEGATRASKDGYVDQKETYYDWLKRQPDGFQDVALGKTRAKLFRDGGLTPEQFAKLNTGKNFKPMTLSEMREQNPAVFANAFQIGDKGLGRARLPLETQQDNMKAMLGDKYDDYLSQVQQDAAITTKADRYRLSEPERVALRMYTDYDAGHFRRMNEMLRGEAEQSSAIHGAAEVLRDALQRLPARKGVVRRVLENQMEWKEGDIVPMHAFSSTTRSKKPVLGGEIKTVITMDSIKGRSIDWISMAKNQKEVLITSPSYHIVMESFVENGVTYVKTMETIKGF